VAGEAPILGAALVILRQWDVAAYLVAHETRFSPLHGVRDEGGRNMAPLAGLIAPTAVVSRVLRGIGCTGLMTNQTIRPALH